MNGVLTLEQFYRGKFFRNGQEQSDFVITAYSSGLTVEQARDYFTAVDIGSASDLRGLDSLRHGFGLHLYDADRFVLSHLRPARFRARGHIVPDFHCLVVPVAALGDDPAGLLTLFDRVLPAPALEPPTQVIAPLALDRGGAGGGGPADLYERDGDGRLTAGLLSAVIGERGITVMNFDPDPERRLAFAAALAALLPPVLRPRLTFATEVFDARKCTACLKFLFNDPYARRDEADLLFDAGRGTIQDDAPLHPYAHWLNDHWRDGPQRLAAAIAAADGDARRARPDATLDETLRDVATGLTLDENLAAGRVEADTLAGYIRRNPTLPPGRLRAYGLDLFRLALAAGRIETTRTLAERGLAGLLEEEWTTQLRAGADRGLGRQAYDLVREWLITPQTYGVSPSGKAQLLDEIANRHLDYLVSQRRSGEVMGMLRLLLDDAPRTGVDAITDARLAIFIRAARDDDELRRALPGLVAAQTANKLPVLLNDATLQSLWPPTFQPVARALTRPSERQEAADLTRAAEVGQEHSDVLLRELVWLATTEQRTRYLMRAPVWRLLRALATQDPIARQWIGDRLSAIETAEWGQALSRDDGAELVNLMFALERWESGVALLHALSASLSATQGGQWIFDFYQKTWLNDSPVACRPLVAAIERSNFTLLWQANNLLAILRRSQWACGEAADRLAHLVAAGQITLSDEATQFKLLEQGLGGALKGTTMAQQLLEKQIKEVIARPKVDAVVNGLNRLVESIHHLPADDQRARYRERVTFRLSEHCRQLDGASLGALVDALKMSPNLRAEYEAANAHLLARTLLGSNGVAGFQQEVRSATEFIERLLELFEAVPGGKPPAFDWATLAGVLRSEAKGRNGNRAQLSQECLRLVHLLDRLAESRTSGVLGLNKNKIMREIYDGKREPAGALDALIRLAGLFDGRQ